MIEYETPSWVKAFTVGRLAHGTEPGVDARETGVHEGSLHIEPSHLMIPRQTHSLNVAWVDGPGEVADTDAVITDVPGLCVAVKTADCIPVLVYDSNKHIVAAIHAGWRGTVGRIVSRTLELMESCPDDLHAIIGPGISLQAFEVGDEVYDAFSAAGFPMDVLAKRFPCETGGERWHIDLWEANAWLLRQYGVNDITVSGVCTRTTEEYYSARRETIRTGRNINGIFII